MTAREPDESSSRIAACGRSWGDQREIRWRSEGDRGEVMGRSRDIAACGRARGGHGEV